MRKLATVMAALLLASCAYPRSSTSQGGGMGFLTFPNAPPNARIMVDGQDAGSASNYTGAHTLAIAPGTHRIEVRSGDTTLVDKRYYVGAGSNIAVQR